MNNIIVNILLRVMLAALPLLNKEFEGKYTVACRPAVK
jgi:hypothetical protein